MLLQSVLVCVMTCFFVCAGTSIHVTRMLLARSPAGEVERGPASPAGLEEEIFPQPVGRFVRSLTTSLRAGVSHVPEL
jgi:hypothetical protein